MKWETFTCKCCGKGDPNPVLKEKIEKLELLLGCEITCNSGYRCQEHNTQVKGAPNSTHLRGMGIDFKAEKGTPHDWAIAAEAVGFGGIHAYKTWCHADVGPDRRWQS